MTTTYGPAASQLEAPERLCNICHLWSIEVPGEECCRLCWTARLMAVPNLTQLEREPARQLFAHELRRRITRAVTAVESERKAERRRPPRNARSQPRRRRKRHRRRARR